MNITRVIVNAVSVFISGIGIGWVLGLSISPTVGIVVTSLLTVIVAVISALAGLAKSEEDKDSEPSANVPELAQRLPSQVNAAPLALLIVGLAFGSCIGIYARTNEWLGPNVGSLQQKWKGVGIPAQTVSKRLFEQVYGGGAAASKLTAPIGALAYAPIDLPQRVATGAPATNAALYAAVGPDECDELKALSGENLRRAMLHSKNERIRSIAGRVRDPAVLKVIVKELICPD